MDRRNRDRLVMTAFCRVAPAANRRRSTWKRIENISGTGMLVVWSKDPAEAKPPRIGERYSVELQLPPHPVFGQRALQFTTKVVRAFQQPNGKLMVGLQSTQSRFRSIAPGTWPESTEAEAVLVN
jgi:c-di-GMP-binding flagellar brake protein YcgR